jgi:hypothetical protein
MDDTTISVDGQIAPQAMARSDEGEVRTERHGQPPARRQTGRPGVSEAESQRLAATIRASGLFDEEWYLRTYPEVARSGRDPILDYLENGAAAGRNPSPLFDTLFYARQMRRAEPGSG